MRFGISQALFALVITTGSLATASAEEAPAAAEPETLDSHMAAGPAVYAIETNKGWFAQKKIKPGDKVTGLPKPKS